MSAAICARIFPGPGFKAIPNKLSQGWNDGMAFLPFEHTGIAAVHSITAVLDDVSRIEPLSTLRALKHFAATKLLCGCLPFVLLLRKACEVRPLHLPRYFVIALPRGLPHELALPPELVPVDSATSVDTHIPMASFVS